MSEKLKAARAWLAETAGEMPRWEVADGMPAFDAGELAHLRELAIDRACATCKWAEATDSPPQMECRRVYYADSIASCGVMSGSHIAMDDGAASLIVAPDFGCVQWEGK